MDSIYLPRDRNVMAGSSEECGNKHVGYIRGGKFILAD
jgi:hypothetical protein